MSKERRSVNGWKTWQGKSSYVGDFLEGKFVNLRVVEKAFDKCPGICDIEAVQYAIRRPPVMWGPMWGFRPEITLDHLTHDTTDTNASGIVKDGFDWKYSKSFKVGKNRLRFSWWRMKISSNTRLDYIRQIQLLFRCVDHPPLGTSPIFNPRPSKVFGNYRFNVPIKFLLDSYKSSMGCNYLDCRVLGTVYFEKGVMYALVICPKNQEQLKHLPSFAKHRDLYTNIDVIDDRYLVWRPFSTCNNERLWDQVCFAFYLEPDKNFKAIRGTWGTFGKCLE